MQILNFAFLRKLAPSQNSVYVIDVSTLVHHDQITCFVHASIHLNYSINMEMARGGRAHPRLQQFLSLTEFKC